MDIVRQSLAITLVFLLLFAALWLLRRKGKISIGAGRSRGAAGILESRAKLVLSQQHTIHLVRIGSSEVVLALHPSGVTLLSERPAERGGEL